ncbi:MAG: hypothetical protein CM15mP117_25140 [Alphaproteobacteria bacterium]|nr:MAG: hypothetical protein CM15mP117_25140 [Alphaproteobacteria bacterium]
MDFDSLKAAGTGLGTAGIIVMDKSTDIIRQSAGFHTFTSMKVVASVLHVGKVLVDVAYDG